MVVASLICFIDWNNDNDFLDTGETVSARVMRAEWFIGRDFASNLTGRSSAGRLILTLNNESGDYNSFNASSPLYGNLVPGRKVQLLLEYNAGAGSVTDAMFTGFLDKISPHVEVNGAHVAQVEAVGPLAKIKSHETSLELQTSQTTGFLISQLLDQAGWPAADSDIDAGNTTITKCIYDGPSTLEAIREIEETEGGFIRETPEGVIVFEDRTRRLETPYTTSQATFSDAAGATLTYSRILQGDPLDQIFNVIKATVQVYEDGAQQVLWTLMETQGANAPGIPAGQTVRYEALFLEDEDVNVGIAGTITCVANTDYTANSQANGLGTDLTASLSFVQTNSSRSTGLAITNNHATLTAYLTLLQVRGTPVTRSDPVAVVSPTDATSEGKYGKRNYVLPARWLPNTDDAKEYVAEIQRVYKVPRPLLSITVSANRDSNHMVQAKARQNSDRITIVANNSTELGISADFHIESQHHVIDAHKHHWVTYECSPAEPVAAIWNLDVDLLDTGTVLHY